MAGESQRFRDAGYKWPKYMLPISGRPLFDWSLMSFQAHFGSRNFLFVARDAEGTGKFLEARLEKLGIAHAEIVMLDGATAGQAETVEVGLLRAGISDSVGITIFNIDTIRPNANLEPVDGTSGWIEVFSATGENWSFVEPKPGASNRVQSCVEKDRISDLCCTGLYNFARSSFFMEALSNERARPSMGELYVAPLYNHLIRAGHEFGWRSISSDQVFLSGVPDEYENLKSVKLISNIF